MKSLGGSLAGAPSAVLYTPDHLEVFAAGPGNTPWRWWLQNGTMHGPLPLPAVPGGIPAEQAEKWAHIDMAGTAWADKDQPGLPRSYIPRGATGFGARLLLEYVLRQASESKV